MDNILDIVEEPGPDINESNLFRYIWLHPTATLRYILRYCPRKHVNLLFFLSGAVGGLGGVMENYSGNQMSLVFALPFGIIGGGIAGWLANHIFAWALNVVGKWLQAPGNYEHIRTVLGWSAVPSISTVVFIGLQFLLFGQDIFTRDLNFDNTAYSVAIIVMALVSTTLNIWSLVILVKGVALVNGFGIGKAALNVVLPFVGFVLVILLFVMLFFTLIL